MLSFTLCIKIDHAKVCRICMDRKNMVSHDDVRFKVKNKVKAKIKAKLFLNLKIAEMDKQPY